MGLLKRGLITRKREQRADNISVSSLHGFLPMRRDLIISMVMECNLRKGKVWLQRAMPLSVPNSKLFHR
jgi:hypothetical protein